MKKFFALILSVILMISTILSVAAAENSYDDSVEAILSQYTIEERLSDAFRGVVDAEVDEELLESISIHVDSNSAETGSLIKLVEETDTCTYSVYNGLIN